MAKDDRNRVTRIVGGVRPSKAVEDQPEVWLAKWRIYEIARPDPDGVAQHLVGWLPSTGSWRVSTAIRSFDPATRCCVTRSGRTYHLQGDPGLREDAWYFWCVCTSLQGIEDARDVTDELAALLEAARPRH